MLSNYLCALLVLCCCCCALSSTSESTSSSSSEITTSTPISTSTISPQQKCENANSSCEECVKITACFYCLKTNKCEYYPYKHIFPKSDDCDMGDIRWYRCWLNFKAFVISMGVIGGILLISFITCLCCCCRRRNKTKLVQEEAKYEREREERRIRNLQRQKDKQSKYDEIRRKYGLLEGLVKEDHPYQRFEA